MRIRTILAVISAGILCASCANEDLVKPDFCPDNPNKTAPGVCGCSMDDVDANGNGIMDCLEAAFGQNDSQTGGDLCQDDENKVVPGACGCGVADTDSDGDGVPDCLDECPNDSAKVATENCGCGIPEVYGADGVFPECLKGKLDLCPDDDDKDEPGICGCGASDVDTDGDGTADCMDQCLDDAEKIYPGICGCGESDVDLDGNTIPDCLDDKVDLCPDDENKTEPGICGCGVGDVDSDGDGVFDCEDQCTDDVQKSEPGACGCGKLDVDTDNDGKADCVDLCPEDAQKVVPGVCGCGTSDADSETGLVDNDGDTLPNCLDLCPDDEKKFEPGVCGCGLEDSGENIADSDGDGVVNCLDLCPDNPLKLVPGQNGCDAVDSDGDGVEDPEDGCPFNPTLTENPGDCNYIEDETGEMVFQIWDVSDLKKLSEISLSLKEDGKAGMACDVDADKPECMDSKHLLSCTNTGSVGGVWMESMCAGVCENDADGKEQCLICQQTEIPENPGDCCTANEYVSNCKDDTTGYQCISGMIMEVNCIGGCSVVDGLLSCKTCKGEVIASGGSEGDCCDAGYAESCLDEGNILYCNGGVVTKAACAMGCAQEEDGQVMCQSCTGETVTTGGEIGQCCSSYTESCLEDGTALKCVSGRVVKANCLVQCESMVNSTSQVVCLEVAPEVEGAMIHARVMRDLSWENSVKREQKKSACVGNWEPVDIYRVQLDGDGHRITFGGEGDRCGVTQPIFGNVLESSISDLSLEYDLKGKISSALARFVSDSFIDHVSWNGNYSGGVSLLSEKSDGFGMFASYARGSVFNELKYEGEIEAISGGFYGHVYRAEGSYFYHPVVKPEKIDINLGTNSLGFGTLDSSLLSNPVIDVSVVN